MTPATVLYGIANCDTVKTARAHLTERRHVHVFHDFRKQGVPSDRLDRWIDALGWQALLNRRGTTWRKLDDAAKTEVVDAASARRLMLAQPSVIKRPVVEWSDGRVGVGFDPAGWVDGRRDC